MGGGRRTDGRTELRAKRADRRRICIEVGVEGRRWGEDIGSDGQGAREKRRQRWLRERGDVRGGGGVLELEGGDEIEECRLAFDKGGGVSLGRGGRAIALSPKVGEALKDAFGHWLAQGIEGVRARRWGGGAHDAQRLVACARA